MFVAWGRRMSRTRAAGLAVTAALRVAAVCCACVNLLAGCSTVPTSPPPPLAPGVAGERLELMSAVGPLSLYRAAPTATVESRPLLLVHSVNAAGSTYEVRPLFEHYRQGRPVYALDLPGFGTSARDDRIYTARLMTDAVAAATASIRAQHDDAPLDALALSLSSEFLARAAVESPAAYRSVAFVSPTGFQRGAPFLGPPGSNRGKPWLHTLFSAPPWRQAFFELLTSERSMRYFLTRTFGSPAIDEGLLAYDRAAAAQPGARYAPYSFVAGFLFSADITRVYEALSQPVWMCHGTRGDFVDYRDVSRFADRPNWRITRFDTGALPHFERFDEFARAYDDFLTHVAATP